MVDKKVKSPIMGSIYVVYLSLTKNFISLIKNAILKKKKDIKKLLKLSQIFKKTI